MVGDIQTFQSGKSLCGHIVTFEECAVGDYLAYIMGKQKLNLKIRIYKAVLME